MLKKNTRHPTKKKKNKNKTQMHRKVEQEKEKRKGVSPPPKEKGDPLNLGDKPVTSRYKYAFQGRDD